MNAVLREAGEIAHAATWRALHAQFAAHRAALTKVSRVLREQPHDRAAQRQARANAHAVWLELRVCWALHFGVERLPC